MRADVVEEGTIAAAEPGWAQSLSAAGARLRALVLLAGSVRPGELGKAINRSLLDLPVEPGRTVLTLWQAAAEALASATGSASLPVRIAIDRSAPEPTMPEASSRAPMQVERDPREFRGTGGILRDLCESYDGDDLILVANAAQILIEPLPRLAADLVAARAVVSLIGHRDGTPGGLFLVRCSALQSAGGVGFLDFKEQLLPRLAAARNDVRVIHRPTATGLPVRTLDGYISGLRSYHRMKNGKSAMVDPFSEDWSPTFAVRDPGAVIDPSANIHDSVVLAGARVERGAVVVRSVVGPGGVIRAGQTVADRVISTPRERARGAR